MKTTVKNQIVKLSFFAIALSFTLTSCESKPQAEEPAVVEVVEEVAPVEEKSTVVVAPERLESGKQVYVSVCQACHMAEGTGVAGVFPPLAKSDFFKADIKRAIHIAANGLSGEIVVNGVTYNQVMPKPEPSLTDQQIADVMTFILNSWDNNGGEVTPEEVSVARK